MHKLHPQLGSNKSNVMPQIIWFAMLCLVAQRLLALLPDAEWVWQANDIGRSLAYFAISLWLLNVISWRDLQSKCLSAALVGYAISDLVCCFMWYVLLIGGYKFNVIIQMITFISSAMFYTLLINIIICALKFIRG